MTAASPPFVFPSRTWQPYLPFPVGHTLSPTSYLLEKSKPSLFSKHGQTTDLQIEGIEMESGGGGGRQPEKCCRFYENPTSLDTANLI